MVVLVCCTDKSYSVALESRLESLIRDRLIRAYLGPEGWVRVEGRRLQVERHQAKQEGRRSSPHWQISYPISSKGVQVSL